MKKIKFKNVQGLVGGFFKPSSEAKENFASTFGPFMGPIMGARLICQFFSAFLGFTVISKTLNEGMLAALPYLVAFAAFVWVLGVETFFDVVVRTASRQLFNLLFGNIWYVAMFAVIVFCGYGVVNYSEEISIKGGGINGDNYIESYVAIPDSTLRNERDLEKQKIINQYQKIKGDINDNEKSELQSIKNDFAGRIKYEKNQIAYHKHRKNNGVKWAESWEQKHIKNKARIEKEKAGELAKVKKKFTDKLVIENNSESTEIKKIDSEYQKKITAHNNAENEKETKIKNKKTDMEGLGEKGGSYFVWGALICIVLEEIYAQGTGQKSKDLPFFKNKNLLFRAYNLFGTLLVLPFKFIIEKLEDITGIDINGDGNTGSGDSRPPARPAPTLDLVSNSNDSLTARDIFAMIKMAMGNNSPTPLHDDDEKNNVGDQSSNGHNGDAPTGSPAIPNGSENEAPTNQENSSNGSENSNPESAESHVATHSNENDSQNSNGHNDEAPTVFPVAPNGSESEAPTNQENSSNGSENPYNNIFEWDGKSQVMKWEESEKYIQMMNEIEELKLKIEQQNREDNRTDNFLYEGDVYYWDEKGRKVTTTYCLDQLNAHIWKITKNKSKQDTWKGNMEKWITTLVILWGMSKHTPDFNFSKNYVIEKFEERKKDYKPYHKGKVKIGFEEGREWTINLLDQKIKEAKMKRKFNFTKT